MILLVYPDCKLTNYQGVSNTISAIQPNIYMALLHSYLKSKNIETLMINCDVSKFSNDKVVEIVEGLKPKLVGVIGIGHNLASSTMSMVGVIDLCTKLKQSSSGSKTFVLGGHTSVLPERTLQETGADYAIVGEGYKEIVDLYRNGSNKQIIKTNRLIDADELPMVDWSSMNPNKHRAHNWHCFGDDDNRVPYATIWTSLGCSFPCSFCSVNNLFGSRGYRKRNLDSVIKEIDLLVNTYNVKNIKIIDDLFITTESRAIQFCDLLEERKYDLNMWCFSRVDTVNENILNRLKKVGMNWIAYGFETPNQTHLDITKKLNDSTSYETVIKITQEAGINIIADVIVGLPDDTYETIKQTYDFCVKSNFEFVNVYPAFAYPGTPFYDMAIKENLMSTPVNWAEYSPYGHACKPLKTKYLCSEEVLILRDKFFKDYHSRPEYLQMIEFKFGMKSKESVEEMNSIELKRVLYD